MTPDEYHEFITLGQGGVFELDLDRSACPCPLKLINVQYPVCTRASIRQFLQTGSSNTWLKKLQARLAGSGTRALRLCMLTASPEA